MLDTEPEAVIAFIYRHLEAATFNKPVVEAWLRTNVEAGPGAENGS